MVPTEASNQSTAKKYMLRLSQAKLPSTSQTISRRLIFKFPVLEGAGGENGVVATGIRKRGVSYIKRLLTVFPCDVRYS